jgi:two-component system, response regulator PdtaR
MLCCSIAAPNTPVTQPMSRILIVEDEVIVAESMSRLLDYAGHEIVGMAKDEASALKQAAAGQPDLVLMDIRLANGSDGIETARKMQSRRPVAVMFMSAHHDTKTRERASSVQSVGFIPKPFMPKDLIDAVAVACGRAKRQDT